MALDLWMLDTALDRAAGVFRAYGWTEPACTFGLSQRWADVTSYLHSGLAAETPVLIRRPTGGGVVDHRQDWTYALALPSQTLSRERPVDLYARVHSLLAQALRASGVETRAAPCHRAACAGPAPNLTPANGRPSVCFEDPVAGDLLHSSTDAKVAGAAMKRTRHGILIQGSVVAPTSLSATERSDLRAAFIGNLAKALKTVPADLPFPSEDGLATSVARFRSSAWNRKR